MLNVRRAGAFNLKQSVSFKLIVVHLPADARRRLELTLTHRSIKAAG